MRSVTPEQSPLPDNDKKPRSFKERYRRFKEQFLNLRGDPREIALGCALGIFIGLTPLLGFHMLLAVFFASLFRWNKLSAAMAVWISNPLTGPFVYSVTYFVGKWCMILVRGPVHHPKVHMDSLIDLVTKAPGVLAAMGVGGVIVGVPAAIAAYYLSYVAIVEYRSKVKGKLVKQYDKIRTERRKRKNP